MNQLLEAPNASNAGSFFQCHSACESEAIQGTTVNCSDLFAETKGGRIRSSGQSPTPEKKGNNSMFCMEK